MSDRIENQANRLDQVTQELEKALAHAKIASSHFRSQEIPRACAHTVAVLGHVAVVNGLLQELAIDHRLAAKTI